MSKIFINSKNIKTDDAHRLKLSHTDKTDPQIDHIMWHYQAFYLLHIGESTETINLKNQEQHELKNLNCLMDLISYQIFKDIHQLKG